MAKSHTRKVRSALTLTSVVSFNLITDKTQPVCPFNTRNVLFVKSHTRKVLSKLEASKSKVELDTVQSALKREQTAFLHRKDALLIKMDANIGLNTGYILALTNKPEEALLKARKAASAFKTQLGTAMSTLSEAESQLKNAESNFQNKGDNSSLKIKSAKELLVEELNGKITTLRSRAKEADVAVSLIRKSYQKGKEIEEYVYYKLLQIKFLPKQSVIIC